MMNVNYDNKRKNKNLSQYKIIFHIIPQGGLSVIHTPNSRYPLLLFHILFVLKTV
jgi:hypothetical protein